MARLARDVFPLQKLSPELRNWIYIYVCTAADATVVIQWRKGQRDMSVPARRRVMARPPGDHLGLLSTCRQIHTEARGMYLSLNTFHCPDTTTLHDFLNAIGHDRRSLVTKLSVLSIDAAAPEAFKLMLSMPKLSDLTFYLPFEDANVGKLLRFLSPAATHILFQLRGLKDLQVQHDIMSEFCAWNALYDLRHWRGTDAEVEEFLGAVTQPRP